jgi:hypothetical protein
MFFIALLDKLSIVQGKERWRIVASYAGEPHDFSGYVIST